MTQGDLRSLLHKLPYQGPGYRRPKGPDGGSPPPHDPGPGPGPPSSPSPHGPIAEGRVSGHKPGPRPSSSQPLPPPSPPPRPPVNTFRSPVSFSQWRSPPGPPPGPVDPIWLRQGRHPRPKPPIHPPYHIVPPPAESGVRPGPSISVPRAASVHSYTSGDSFSEEKEILRRRELRLHDQEARMREREMQVREQEARLRIEIDPRLRGDRAEQVRVQEEAGPRRAQVQIPRSEEARRVHVLPEGLHREGHVRRLERQGDMPERE